MARFASLTHGQLDRRNSLSPGSDSPCAVFPESMSRPASSLDLSAADILILDNDVRGGAKAFCDSYCARLENEGKTILLVRFNRQSLHYDLLLRSEGKIAAAAVKTSHDLFTLITENLPRKIFCNNIFPWPDPLDALAWLKRAAAFTKVEIYLHDFLPICPTVVLLDSTFRFCGLPRERHACDVCLRRNLLAAPYTPRSITPWRDAWSAVLASASVLWGPHESVGELLAQIYPDTQARFKVFPLPGLPALKKRTTITPDPMERPAVIGVIGSIDIHKGALIVADLVKLLERLDGEFRLVVIGELLLPVASACLTVTGRYRREELPELMARHNVMVGLVPSVWPETYCYVVDELMQLKVPVVSFDLGAQGWKTRHYARGVCAETISAESCLQAVKQVLHEKLYVG